MTMVAPAHKTIDGTRAVTTKYDVESRQHIRAQRGMASRQLLLQNDFLLQTIEPRVQSTKSVIGLLGGKCTGTHSCKQLQQPHSENIEQKAIRAAATSRHKSSKQTRNGTTKKIMTSCTYHNVPVDCNQQSSCGFVK